MFIVFHDQVDIYLVVFLGNPGGNTLTVVTAVGAAGTVSTTALHQEAAGPENGIRPFQLLTQGDRKVAWSAAVQPNLLPQEIEISSSSKKNREDRMITITSSWNERLLCNRTVTYRLKMSYLWVSCWGWRISPARAMWVYTTLPYPPAIAPALGTAWPPPWCSVLPQPLTTPQYPAGMEGEPQGLLALIHSVGKPAWRDGERREGKVIYSWNTTKNVIDVRVLLSKLLMDLCNEKKKLLFLCAIMPVIHIL